MFIEEKFCGLINNRFDEESLVQNCPILINETGNSITIPHLLLSFESQLEMQCTKKVDQPQDENDPVAANVFINQDTPYSPKEITKPTLPLSHDLSSSKDDNSIAQDRQSTERNSLFVCRAQRIPITNDMATMTPEKNTSLNQNYQTSNPVKESPQVRLDLLYFSFGKRSKMNSFTRITICSAYDSLFFSPLFLD